MNIIIDNPHTLNKSYNMLLKVVTYLEGVVTWCFN